MATPLSKNNMQSDFKFLPNVIKIFMIGSSAYCFYPLFELQKVLAEKSDALSASQVSRERRSIRYVGDSSGQPPKFYLQTHEFKTFDAKKGSQRV